MVKVFGAEALIRPEAAEERSQHMERHRVHFFYHSVKFGEGIGDSAEFGPEGCQHLLEFHMQMVAQPMAMRPSKNAASLRIEHWFTSQSLERHRKPHLPGQP